MLGLPFWTAAVALGANIAIGGFGDNYVSAAMSAGLLSLSIGLTNRVISPMLGEIVSLDALQMGPVNLANTLVAAVLYRVAMKMLGFSAQNPFSLKPLLYSTGYVIAIEFVASFLSGSASLSGYGADNPEGP